MRNTVISLTVCLANLTFAGQTHVLPSGLVMETPDGWLLKPTGKSVILAPPQQDSEREFYRTGVMTDLRSFDNLSTLPALVAGMYPLEGSAHAIGSARVLHGGRRPGSHLYIRLSQAPGPAPGQALSGRS